MAGIITVARVKRNKANTRMEMAREFLNQDESFRLYRVSEMIDTLRSYEKDGLFIIKDSELILIHKF